MTKMGRWNWKGIMECLETGRTEQRNGGKEGGKE